MSESKTNVRLMDVASTHHIDTPSYHLELESVATALENPPGLSFTLRAYTHVDLEAAAAKPGNQKANPVLFIRGASAVGLAELFAAGGQVLALTEGAAQSQEVAAVLKNAAETPPKAEEKQESPTIPASSNAAKAG